MDSGSHKREISQTDAYLIAGGLLLIDVLVLVVALLLASFNVPR